MARNRARLVDMGLLKAVAGLAELNSQTKRPAPPATAPTPQQKQGTAGHAMPTRKSPRLRGEKPSSQGLDLGPAAVQDADAEERPEVKQKPAKKRKGTPGNEEEKLKQLELSGLVDINEAEAVFVVVGSTGSHYTVRLFDDRRSCECMDHRTRRHDCKHIRLILGAMGLGGTAVEKVFAAGAAARKAEEGLSDDTDHPAPAAAASVQEDAADCHNAAAKQHPTDASRGTKDEEGVKAEQVSEAAAAVKVESGAGEVADKREGDGPSDSKAEAE
ncbi:MAG: hypothetical protein WDW38_003564 [Sanguina aurantia]